MRIHWGVQAVIHLKENVDQRTVVTVRKRNSCRFNGSPDYDSDDDIQLIPRDDSYTDVSTCSDTTINTDNSMDMTKCDTGIESGKY